MIGRWLGVNHHCQEALSSHVLKANGRIVTCTTVQALTADDLKVPNFIKLMEQHVRDAHAFLTIKNSAVRIDGNVDDFRRLFYTKDSCVNNEFSVDEIDVADKYNVRYI